MRLISLALLLVLTACGASDAPGPDQIDSITTHEFYLVRHAEKQTGDDPLLTPEGEARAATLAQILADKGLTQIHSTNYRRTLETAAPIAERTGLEVALYDPRDLSGFADELRASKGVHLVVGHSNTTPQLAQALGAEPGSEIDESSEYDRLYVITLDSGEISSRIERFGVRYQNNETAPVDLEDR